MPETVTVHRAGSVTTDRHGNEIPVDGAPVVHTPYAVWQVGADELLAGQDQSVTRMRVVFLELVDVLATDEMTVRGQRLKVDAPPAIFKWKLSGRTVTQVDLVARN